MLTKSKESKRVGLGLVIAASYLVLLPLDAILAKKPEGKPEVLHGSTTFRDFSADTVQSDDSGAYSDAVDATVLGLGEFFRLSIKLKKNGGRSLSLDFTGQDIDPDFLPANSNIWNLWIEGTLADWRAQALDTAVLR